MYLTQKNQIKGLTKAEYKALRELCRLSKNLYNVGLYSVRQFFFEEKRYLRYESNYHVCKDNENYKLLNTDIAQQTLKVVDRSFRSFFSLIKAAKQSLYRFEQISLPKYLKKDGYFPLIMPRIKIKDGQFEVPMSRAFKKDFGSIAIPFPERLKDKRLKEARILPKCGAQWFEVEFITEEPKEPQNVNPNNAVAIDLGIDNLAACVSTTGASIVIDGKKLKSINQWYNKLNAKLQSVKDKQGKYARTLRIPEPSSGMLSLRNASGFSAGRISGSFPTGGDLRHPCFPQGIKHLTKHQGGLLKKRSNQVRDYLRKTARLIVNWCITQQAGMLIVGVNPGWKQKINIGKCNNQSFVQIPFYILRSKLSALCERYGIHYVEQEESYSSKASALDGDSIPTYSPDNSAKAKFSGKRVKRGLYRSQAGCLVNADCNGSWNIGRKSKHEGFTGVSRGVLAAPLRVFIS